MGGRGGGGGIYGNGKTDLVIFNANLNAQRYCDEIIRPIVLPFMRRDPGFLFQQDNARPHTARIPTTSCREAMSSW